MSGNQNHLIIGNEAMKKRHIVVTTQQIQSKNDSVPDLSILRVLYKIEYKVEELMNIKKRYNKKSFQYHYAKTNNSVK